MELNREQLAILDHTAHRAAGGFYCGDSPDMQALVAAGLMESAGRKSFVPDEYFRMTCKGREALRSAKREASHGAKGNTMEKENTTERANGGTSLTEPLGSDDDWVDCWNCGGEGCEGHDCGEDCCCCADPEPNVPCHVCHGKGGWKNPNSVIKPTSEKT